MNVLAAFDVRKTLARSKFERYKECFSKKFDRNPVFAIGESKLLCESQSALSAFDTVDSLFINEVGSKYRNHAEAIEAGVEYLKSFALEEAAASKSSDGAVNFTRHCMVVGFKATIDELEYILNHPAA